MSKTALITGGSRGIGLGIATSLAKEGWNIAINGVRDESQIASVLAELKNLGVEVIYSQGSIDDLHNHESIVLQTIDKFGQINLLVNNAGVGPKNRLDILETTPESYDRVMNTNLRGPFFLSQMVANHMIETRAYQTDLGASIINIGSISANISSTNRGEYCLSKAGMGMMTKLFADRLGEFNIPVFELRPGIIQTDMTSGVKDKYDQLIENGLTVQKRWGQPEDVGKAVASLARGDFHYSSGQAIYIDGGINIQRL